jgi:hypothetical protein
MTPTLNPTELLAVNQGRYERGLPPLAVSLFPRTVQAAAQPIPAQPYTPLPNPFAQSVNAAISRSLGAKRYTRPSEPEGEPSTFAEQLRQATERRRKGYKSIKQPT